MKRAVLLPLLGALAVVAAPAPGRALTAVCAANWTGTVSVNTSASGVLNTTAPCPSTSVTAQVTVGSGANAGQINTGDAIVGSGTNQFVRSPVSSMDIGVPNNGNFARTVTFSQAVSNPYLFFTYLDVNTSFTFTQPFVLVQANKATVSGQTVSALNTVSNNQNDGFVVQMTGSFSTINFDYNNTSGAAQTVAFTTGINQVPGPLPLAGAGVAFGFSRRLRRRIRSRA